MGVEVRTKQELKQAIARREPEIFVLDERLAEHVLRFKAIRRLTKWMLIALLGAVGIGAVGIALIPFTGGTSAPMAAYMTIHTAVGTTTAVETGSIIAIGYLAILGLSILYALYKDYEVEVAELGGIAKGVKLTQRRTSKP